MEFTEHRDVRSLQKSKPNRVNLPWAPWVAYWTSLGQSKPPPLERFTRGLLFTLANRKSNRLFGSWNVCGDALTSLSPPRSSYLILPVSLSFYMAVSRGSCRKQWKARSMPLVPHVIELCSTSRELIGCPMLKSMI